MNQTETATLPPARRANDYLIRHKRFREPAMLFDEFWREGEVALFFGAAGSGKSIFAVQLADALSRGRGLHGFRTPRGRRRILYVDLRHTDEQFLMRCAWRNGNTLSRPHRFPKNLLRDRPLPGQDLCEWLRAYVLENRVQAVIVDDLSAVKNTHDGTRETLRLMRRLRALRDELHISILVLAESSEPPRTAAVTEADLGRSRVLCTAADSVFAAGRNRKSDGDHYLVQTRCGSASAYWTWRNAPVADISRTATGLLSFEFDERFGPDMPEEKRRLICEVSRLHEVEFKTFREIARQLNISKSWACELYQKWTPALEQWSVDSGQGSVEGGAPDGQDEDDEWDESEIPEDEGASSPPYEGGVAPASGDGVVLSMDGVVLSMDGVVLSMDGVVLSMDGVVLSMDGVVLSMDGVVLSMDGVVLSMDGVVLSRSGENTPKLDPRNVSENHPPAEAAGPLLRKEGSLADIDVSAIPFAAALTCRSIHDLALGYDGYGNEIYIETRCGHTGKPSVWYQLDKKGTKRRFTRDPLGIRVEHLGPGPFL